MITNAPITIYHKIRGRVESYERYNYLNVWVFGGHGASINEGLIDKDDLNVRISYKDNVVDSKNIAIGDIIVIGTLDTDITSESQLDDYYTITSIKDNQFGGTPHIHIGAK